MTDPLIEQIKADAEKGTLGLWEFRLSDVQTMGDEFQVSGVDGGGVVCCNTVYYPTGVSNDNMRRIARVPEMEARILADAEEKAALRDKLSEAQAALECVRDATHHPVELMYIARTALTSIGDSDE